MRLIYADYNPYTNSIDVNTFENYILRIAAFCGLSFLLAIKITSKLSNFILHPFGGLHKLWDTPNYQQLVDDLSSLIFANDSYAIAGSLFLIIASTSSTPVSATSAI